MKTLTGAFLGIYTKGKNGNIHIMFINRWDGRIGFVGGFVGDENQNETVETALVREAKEEIGLEIREENLELNYKAEYEKNNGKLVLYFVPFEVEYGKFIEILKNLPNSEHFLYETMGYNIFTINEKDIKNYKETKQYKNFIKNNLATDVRNELDYLLELIIKNKTKNN